ncbi:MAG: bifunctional hexulose-6-phosphate synthase/ribonuclease regulator, partial [Planctomycetes bacterium]|nr:bifunctional hexulose-6-phosphate synthase/ribonuclease regulator [Planctomycetota bacterium]
QCVETGRQYGLAVAVDLMGVADPVAAAAAMEALGVDWVDVHCPIDRQMQGADPLDQIRRVRSACGLTLAAAGGLTSETAAGAVAAGADVIIVGGAITKAIDPQAATAAIRTAIDTGEAVAGEGLFRRAAADTIRQILQTVRTANISDGSHRQPCLAGLHPLWIGAVAIGPAVTVRTVAGDWSKPVQAIDAARPGEVIVIDAGGRPPAVWGELATESAVGKALAGLVVDGAVRDSADIRRLAFPVWSAQVTSHAGDANGVGQINVPITIAGQRICPGDWIAADDDGVMVLPAAKAVEMANRAADVLEAENRIRQEIRDRSGTLAKVLDLKRWEQKGMAPEVG